MSKVVKEGTKNSKYAKLDYEVLKYDEELNLSVLKILLHTGRHHQIRVQLSSRNHSIYGDQKYGGRGHGKQITLWAYMLKIFHPVTKEEMIFKAFQRGLRAFIEEYDRQNPKNPLTQINIGMGYNRLKRQVERFKKATSNLTVPSEYSFQDAMTNEQHILYQREQKQIENGGQDR